MTIGERHIRISIDIVSGMLEDLQWIAEVDIGSPEADRAGRHIKAAQQYLVSAKYYLESAP